MKPRGDVMPSLHVRKVIDLGGSKVVAIPKHWLKYWETKFGCEIREVTVKTDGSIIIKPKIKEK